MQRLNAASCLLIALLSSAVVCLAAKRVKVEVVQTHTGVTLGSCGTEQAGDSDPTWSRCNRNSGVYTRELGFHCAGASLSSPATAESSRDSAFFYDVRVIMPNAAQLVFHCSTILDENCEGFPEYPDGATVACSDFVYRGKAYKDCTATGPVAGSLGVYRAALHGDRMTIFGPNWRRSYVHHGTWQFDARAAQDPKPAPPPDPNPAPSEENKPAPETKPDAPDTQPAQKPDDKPDVPPKTKPDAPDTQPAQKPDDKPDAPPGTKPDAPDTQPTQKPDDKPDAPPETKPGAAETQPTPPPESKPAPTENATVGSNGADAPRTELTRPALAVEQAIDPRLIEQAKAGDQVAQYKIGYDYFLGRGVPIDYVQAAIWWRKAADQGYPEAQNNLGVLYNSGKGVPQSFAEAYFWQNLAASRANGPLQEQFAKNRDESASKLWLLSRLKVQQRAAKWATDHPVPPRSHEPAEEKRGQYP
jgi:uncharacterized protein